MKALSNVPYSALSIGQQASSIRVVSRRDIQLFALASGDWNPLHLDEDYAATTSFGECIAHGMFTGGLVSAVLANQLPGPGTVYLEQTLRFRAPVRVGDTLETRVSVSEKRDRGQRVVLACEVVNQDGKRVASGTATVIAPAESLTVMPRSPDLDSP